MDFVTAVKTCILQKYMDFNGRARRSEYWWFMLFYLGANFVCNTIDAFALGGLPIFGIILWLGLLLPSLGVAIRRLHDTDRSGWWLLIMLIPLIGVVVLIVFMCLRGTDGPNRFGADPTAST